MPPEDAIPRAPPLMDSNRGGGPTHLVPVETCGPVGLAHSISYRQCITISSCMTQLFSARAWLIRCLFAVNGIGQFAVWRPIRAASTMFAFASPTEHRTHFRLSGLISLPHSGQRLSRRSALIADDRDGAPFTSRMCYNVYIMMARTQITLEAELQRQARQRASELGVSLAEYLRRLVARDLTRPTATAELDGIFDLGNSGGSDIAKDKDSMIAESLDVSRRRGRRP